jgi:hypothetical protein
MTDCAARHAQAFLPITTRVDEASTLTHGGDAFWYGASPKVAGSAYRG